MATKQHDWTTLEQLFSISLAIELFLEFFLFFQNFWVIGIRWFNFLQEAMSRALLCCDILLLGDKEPFFLNMDWSNKRWARMEDKYSELVRSLSPVRCNEGGQRTSYILWCIYIMVCVYELTAWPDHSVAYRNAFRSYFPAFSTGTNRSARVWVPHQWEDDHDHNEPINCKT